MNELNLTKEKDFLERVSKIFVTLEMHNKVQEICAKSEIKRLHLLLDAGVSKKDIAKLLRISVDSIRRIEKDLAELGA